MCTVTIARLAGRRLVTMNRDEAPDRREFPPRLWSDEAGAFLAPVDERAGGTWIGANAHGLASCLLNRYEAAPPKPASRGKIVLATMRCSNAGEASAALSAMPLGEFAAFTLLLSSTEEDRRLDWDGDTLTDEILAIRDVWMMTSSGWRSEETQAHRERRFHELTSAALTQTAIETFHASLNPGDEELGPLMLRPHSRTRSITQVTFADDVIEMRYWRSESAIARGLTHPDALLVLPSHESGGRRSSALSAIP